MSSDQSMLMNDKSDRLGNGSSRPSQRPPQLVDEIAASMLSGGGSSLCPVVHECMLCGAVCVLCIVHVVIGVTILLVRMSVPPLKTAPEGNCVLLHAGILHAGTAMAGIVIDFVDCEVVAPRFDDGDALVFGVGGGSWAALGGNSGKGKHIYNLYAIDVKG